MTILVIIVLDATEESSESLGGGPVTILEDNRLENAELHTT